MVKLTNSWWSLPRLLQTTIKRLVPNRGCWTLDCYRRKEDWAFDLPQFLTFAESLTNGTEKAVDATFKRGVGRDAVEGDRIRLTISRDRIKGASTVLTWIGADDLWPGSNYYESSDSGLVCWLCPYLGVLFKGPEAPKRLWVLAAPQLTDADRLRQEREGVEAVLGEAFAARLYDF